MDLKEHCLESIKLFGKPFKEVHEWLDEFAGSPGIGMRHRKIRHHLAGLSEIERTFGAEAVPAAKAHIIADLKMEGWTENDPFPVNEEHYVKMGLF